MFFTNLPELALDVIVQCLPFNDLMNLSNTCSTLLQLRPKFKEIEIDSADFCTDVTSMGCLFVPVVLFQIPIFCGIRSVQMSFHWNPQGNYDNNTPFYAYNNIQIWLELSRGKNNLSKVPYEISPNQWTNREITVEHEEVITKARCGDILKVLRNAGGDVVNLKTFKMIIFFEEVQETIHRYTFPDDGTPESLNVQSADT